MGKATEPEPSRRLGDFEITREIGRGGMGVVYEARQLSLSRKVALKVLSGSLGLSSKAIVRFRREAEAAAKLHHTNIVPIYATGEEDGTHFYAMELIEGPSLNVVIRELRRGVTAARDHEEPEPEAQARNTDAQARAVIQPRCRRAFWRPSAPRRKVARPVGRVACPGASAGMKRPG